MCLMRHLCELRAAIAFEDLWFYTHGYMSIRNEVGSDALFVSYLVL